MPTQWAVIKHCNKLLFGLIVFLLLVNVYMTQFSGKRNPHRKLGDVIHRESRHRERTLYVSADKLSEHPRKGVVSSQRGVVSEECRIILEGDTDGIRKLRESNTSKREFPWRDVTTDHDVIDIASNCTHLRQRYRFPPFSGSNFTSDEEMKFPLAFSIMMHENSNQLLVLLSAIYREQNVHCIHLDSKSPPEVYEALSRVTTCFPNVFLATRRYRVVYASVARLLAEIGCMKDLLAIPKTVYDWKYLINLCSQDFPLRTNNEIIDQMKAFRGFNSIGGHAADNEQTKTRTEFVHRVEIAERNGVKEERVVKTSTPHPPPPFNMTVVKNLAYNFFTRDFLQWALVDSQVGPALLNWSMDTYSPDEHYWLMLNMFPGAPGGSKLMSGYQLARQIKWLFTNDKSACHGQWRHYICVYGAEDIHELTRTRNLFVNKVDIKLDSAGPECLRQWLDERHLPEDQRIDNPNFKPSIPSESFFL